MIALLGSLLGFLASAVPDIFKLIQDKRDKAHEVALLELQMQAQQQGHIEKMEEIGAQADIAEAAAIYKTYTVGIGWVDALTGTVRPVLTYLMFSLYAAAKWLAVSSGLAWQIWTEADMTIFCTIISFWFGGRAMSKMRNGK